MHIYIHVHNTIANSHILSIYDCYYPQSSPKAMISIDVIHCSIKGCKIGINSLKMALSCRNMSEWWHIYRVIQKDGLNWTVNGASTHARQLVAVFKVLCSLYGLTCVGYAQKQQSPTQLMNSRTQKILCCIVAILLLTDAAVRLCTRRAP